MDDEILILELCQKATRDKPISNHELSVAIQASGTAVRIVIAALRDKGYRICSVSTGYFIAKTEAEYKEFRAYYMGKINKRLKRVYAMDAYTESQTEMRLEC